MHFGIGIGVGRGSGKPKTLQDIVRAWQDAQAAYVQISGPSAVANNNHVGNFTLISGIIPERILQDGYVRQVKVYMHELSATPVIKIKVFRPNGANYDFVGESEEITPAGTGERTITLSTPIPCRPGDVLGVWTNAIATSLWCKTVAGVATIRYTVGDITDTNAFASTLNALSLGLVGLAHPPYLATTGDSIVAGYPDYVSMYSGGPSGTIENQVQYQLRELVGGSVLKYQNLAYSASNSTFAWALSTGVPACITKKPNSIIILAGVNDINNSRLWSAVEADLNAIKALVDAATPVPALLISEILPWTNGTDVQAGTVRTWNANLATWCAANDAILITCHDAMGQTRVSTGELDDLKTAYDLDGVHLTSAGISALATLWKPYL